MAPGYAGRARAAFSGAARLCRTEETPAGPIGRARDGMVDALPAPRPLWRADLLIRDRSISPDRAAIRPGPRAPEVLFFRGWETGGGFHSGPRGHKTARAGVPGRLAFVGRKKPPFPIAPKAPIGGDGFDRTRAAF
jgi:hypothetical protein